MTEGGNSRSSGGDSGDLLEAMLAFQQGHRDAFDALYQAIWSPVCLRAARMGLRAEESEEITQKVLVRIFLYCAKAEFRSTAQIWSWVYTITVREVYKHWRRRRPELVSEEGLELLQRQAAAADDDPVTLATDAEVLSAVDDCIGRLGEAERLYLLGPLVQGLPFRQAAALHGLTLGQFKHRYEQALDAVRTCMESKGHGLRRKSRTDSQEDD